MVPSIVPSVDASIAAAAGRGRGAIDANRGRSPSPVARTPTRRGGGTAGRVATNASARLGPTIDRVHYDGREGGIEGSNTAAVPGMRRGARPARAFELASNAPAPRGRRGSASLRTNAADPGGSEVMKSVAERVKAARELAKRLADQEASLGGGDDVSRVVTYHALRQSLRLDLVLEIRRGVGEGVGRRNKRGRASGHCNGSRCAGDGGGAGCSGGRSGSRTAAMATTMASIPKSFSHFTQ